MSSETAKQEPAIATKGMIAKADTKGMTKEKQPRSKTSHSGIVAKVSTPKADAKGKQAEIPDGLSKQYYGKSTYNTSDIMHSPVEKTLQMLDKILAGQKLFTM